MQIVSGDDPSFVARGPAHLRELTSFLDEACEGTNMAKWVRSLSFQQLVKAVYDKYPEMRANSVLQG